MAQQSEVDQVELFDKALQRYYEALGHEYDSIFKDYCEDNGIDLDDEFEAGAHDCQLVEFDDDFPFPTNEQYEDKDKREQWIFNLLKKIRAEPNIDFDYLKSKLPDGLLYVLIR